MWSRWELSTVAVGGGVSGVAESPQSVITATLSVSNNSLAMDDRPAVTLGQEIQSQNFRKDSKLFVRNNFVKALRIPPIPFVANRQ